MRSFALKRRFRSVFSCCLPRGIKLNKELELNLAPGKACKEVIPRLRSTEYVHERHQSTNYYGHNNLKRTSGSCVHRRIKLNGNRSSSGVRVLRSVQQCARRTGSGDTTRCALHRSLVPLRKRAARPTNLNAHGTTPHTHKLTK